MKLEEAIEIIEEYNQWRRGNIDDLRYTPKEITSALKILIKTAKTK